MFRIGKARCLIKYTHTHHNSMHTISFLPLDRIYFYSVFGRNHACTWWCVLCWRMLRDTATAYVYVCCVCVCPLGREHEKWESPVTAFRNIQRIPGGNRISSTQWLWKWYLMKWIFLDSPKSFITLVALAKFPHPFENLINSVVDCR